MAIPILEKTIIKVDAPDLETKKAKAEVICNLGRCFALLSMFGSFFFYRSFFVPLIFSRFSNRNCNGQFKYSNPGGHFRGPRGEVKWHNGTCKSR